MAKSIKDNLKKGRGRPATGNAPMVGLRMTEALQAEVRAWARKQEDSPALATAIRRLVELGLAVRQPRKSTAKAAARAAELAAGVLDSHADKAASVDERATRKTRLLKGPSAFRDIRKDRHK